MTSLRQYPTDGDTSPEAMARLGKFNQQLLEVVEKANGQWVDDETVRLEKERLEKLKTP